MKLKAELKAFYKPTQKVVTGVACSVRWQALAQRSSAFRESIRKKFAYGSKETIGHGYGVQYRYTNYKYNYPHHIGISTISIFSYPVSRIAHIHCAKTRKERQ